MGRWSLHRGLKPTYMKRATETDPWLFFILTRQLFAEAYELAGVRTELVAEGA